VEPVFPLAARRAVIPKEESLSSSAGMLIIYVVAFIAIFYFMAIRPQQKQRRAHAALLSALKKGDRVVTAAGIYGTVKRVEDNIVVVEIAKGVSMKIARRAVAEIIRDQAEIRAAAPEGTAGRGKAAAAELEEASSVDEVESVESAASGDTEAVSAAEEVPGEESPEAEADDADKSKS
jgi:preprotein translocase subunit YajC